MQVTTITNDLAHDHAKYNLAHCDLMILSRYPSNDSAYTVYAVLSLHVLSKLASFKDIYQKMVKHNFLMTIAQISDLCVNMFDTDALHDVWDGPAIYAYRLPDGRVIAQHST